MGSSSFVCPNNGQIIRVPCSPPSWTLTPHLPARPLSTAKRSGNIWLVLCEANEHQTVPFLVRTFVKIGGFHRIALFEDGTLPTTDEQQHFTWCVVCSSPSFPLLTYP